MTVQEADAKRYLEELYPNLVLGKQLGYGATSTVYDLPGTAPPQVIKFMDTRSLSGPGGSQEHRKRMWNYFCNEAETMEELKSCPYIMQMYDWAEYVDPMERGMIPEHRSYQSVFLVRLRKMLCLSDFLTANGMTEEDLVKMAMDVCMALQTCEEHRILHRDVKPNNIFAIRNWAGYRFVLGDFGFCRRFERANIPTLTMCGTEAFQAPEIKKRTVVENEYNSDLYSLGVTMYYLASNGAFPNDVDIEGKQAKEDLKNISAELAAIICQAVEPDPRRRQQHAIEMYRQLKQMQHKAGTTVITGRCFIVTKQAMLNGRYDAAIQCAMKGSRQQEEGCLRLLAYCMYHEARELAAQKGEKDSMQRHTVEHYRKKAEEILDKLVFEGDAIAQYIRAQIALEKGDLENFRLDIQESAEDGCVLAAYLYGRVLYYGVAGVPVDRAAGCRYLRKAAEANYMEACRILLRIASEDPNCRIAPEMLARLKGSPKLNEKQKQENLVKFL